MDGITVSMDMNLSKLHETVRDKGGLACCSPWGCKELDMPERLTNNNNQETRSTIGAISKAATMAGTSWLLSPSAESWLISELRGEVSLHILGQK